MALQVVEIPNVGGGVNDYVTAENIMPSEARDTSRNIRGQADAYLPRGGYTTFADVLTGGGVVAFGAYLRNLETNDRLAMVQDDNLFTIDPSSATSWTNAYTFTGGTQTEMDLVAYRDWLFMFNGVDKPFRVEGGTVTQDFTAPASVSTANFLPAFGDVYGSSLFVSGVPQAPNTIFISKASSSATPEDVYDFSGALSSFGNANEILLQSRVTAIRKLSTAVCIFTVDGAIYVPGLKEFGSSVTFDVQPIGGASGAVSQKSTVVVENDIYYLTPQKEIKSIKRGFSDTLSVITTPMSTRIQKFLTEEIDDDLSSAFAYYDQTNKLYKLHLKAKGGTENSITIVGDVNELDEQGVPSWFIDDSRPFTAGIYYKGKPYVGSAQIGQAYSDEDGFADDDDAAVITKRVSKNFTANNPTTTKNFREVVIFGEMTTSTVITATIYVDDISVCEVEINADDLPSQGTLEGGGIGTEEIGSFEIGSEGEGAANTTTRFEFVKRIPIRQTGKKIRIETSTDGNANNYSISHQQYAFLAKTYLYNPVIEK
tara:strand:- start:8083 stop:9705 length:1623 start_codon:yes stop_codon:yes gene_type:complete